jgi:DNA adenine methylase
MVAAYPATDREYYRLRQLKTATLCDTERAARFIYLNRYCFNGIYRVNRRGEFNVPRGRKTGSLPSERDYARCAKALSSARLTAYDYVRVLSRCRRGDFVYLDPPYTNPTRRHKGEYGYGTFDEADLPRFAELLEGLDAKGVNFLVSYADAPAFYPIARRWDRLRVVVRRTVSCTPVRRTPVAELLVANYDLQGVTPPKDCGDG